MDYARAINELREITRMYQEVTNFGSQEVRL